MEKYLYLTRPEWQHSWVHGGTIPISLASTYFRRDRGGIYTPDETLIYRSSVDLRSLGIVVGRGASIGKIVLKNAYVDGVRMPDCDDGTIRNEDGIILSFCDVASREIAVRLEKACCVKILDVTALRPIIDAQLGVEGIMDACAYTEGHERNHFLKSHEDSWQKEYRIFWPVAENKHVTLPPGVAVPIDI